MTNSLYYQFLFLFVVALLASCDSTSSPTLSATYSSINTQLFEQSCAVAGCHDDASKAGELSLEGQTSFENLINVQSYQDSTALLVAPYSPEQSFILQKIENPNDSPAHKDKLLSSESIDIIRTWIKQGAVVAQFNSIQNQIFSRYCTVCHTGSNPPGDLNLEAGQSYLNLVNVKRPYDPEIRVISGDADNSFLIDKLSGKNLGNSRGDRMPLSATPLAPEIIDTIAQWINAGALP